MTEMECKAIFTLAGIEVLRVWELANQYWPRPTKHDDDGENYTRQYFNYLTLRNESPWWLVKTPLGFIEIGWRKRVISIDWSDTGIECEVTHESVTKSPTMVHAYSNDDAVKYLRVLSQFALSPKAT